MILQLLGAVRFLKPVAKATGGLLLRYPREILIVALALALVRIEQLRGAEVFAWQRAASAWHHAADARLHSAIAVAKAAEVKALVQRAQVARIQAEVAHAADHQLEVLRRAAADALTRYAAVHPAGRSPDLGAAGSADVPGAPARGDGPGDVADLVAISRADLDHLVDAAMRLAVVHQWGEGLIDAGLAAPAAPQSGK